MSYVYNRRPRRDTPQRREGRQDGAWRNPGVDGEWFDRVAQRETYRPPQPSREPVYEMWHEKSGDITRTVVTKDGKPVRTITSSPEGKGYKTTVMDVTDPQHEKLRYETPWLVEERLTSPVTRTLSDGKTKIYIYSGVTEGHDAQAEKVMTSLR